MNEHPILFSAPMVRAILEGRKTQTRRIVKPKPDVVATDGTPGRFTPVDSKKGRIAEVIQCPYGQPGDRLWVKEGWAQEHPLAVQEGRYSQEGRAGIPGPPGVTFRVIYRSDGEPLQVWRRSDNKHPYFTLDGPADETSAKYPSVCSNFQRGGKAIYWDSPLFMERRFSRITLEITGVRVERLQEISEADAIAEGLKELQGGARSEYAVLWDHINGKRAPWASNPWVWVVEFKRAQP